MLTYEFNFFSQCSLDFPSPPVLVLISGHVRPLTHATRDPTSTLHFLQACTHTPLTPIANVIRAGESTYGFVEFV